jgi:hypothetical protein
MCISTLDSLERRIKMEHPMITQINRIGYPNMVAQHEHAGIDYFGNEVLQGDEIIEDNDEVILKENLERYLQEVYGFQFKLAE